MHPGKKRQTATRLNQPLLGQPLPTNEPALSYHNQPKKPANPGTNRRHLRRQFPAFPDSWPIPPPNFRDFSSQFPVFANFRLLYTSSQNRIHPKFFKNSRLNFDF
jgi:hypothetical protein